MTDSPRLADVDHARQIIGRFLPPTPLLRSPPLSERTGCEVYVKYENMSPVRSFKARGGLYCVARLAADGAGVCCASTGNHGQGIAYGAKCFNQRAVVVVPEGANEQKMRAIEELGAELHVAGKTLTEANAAARELAERERLCYIEDGENPDVMVGCATLALELVEQLPELDCLFVPVGGGNLAAACCFVLGALKPSARIVGVQAAGAPAVYESWRLGKPIVLDQCETFAGGLASSYPGHFTYPYLQRGLADFLLVSDAEIRAAAFMMLAATGHLPEGAGATALAGLLANPAPSRGQKVVVLLTGGNFEATLWTDAAAALGATTAHDEASQGGSIQP